MRYFGAGSRNAASDSGGKKGGTLGSGSTSPEPQIAVLRRFQAWKTVVFDKRCLGLLPYSSFNRDT